MTIQERTCYEFINEINQLLNSAEYQRLKNLLNNPNNPDFVTKMISKDLIYFIRNSLIYITKPLKIIDSKTFYATKLYDLILSLKPFFNYSILDLIYALEELTFYISPFEFIVEETEAFSYFPYFNDKNNKNIEDLSTYEKILIKISLLEEIL